MKSFFGTLRNWPILVVAVLGTETTLQVHAQASKRPLRAIPPRFDAREAEGMFFADLESILIGELPPASNERKGEASKDSSAEIRSEDVAVPAGSEADLGASSEWKALISAASLEDLVKGSKLQLDQILTTPSAFASGGFQEARNEFSLLALLFAIIEAYPEEVRWKAEAASLKIAMNRVAANAKVGSRQVYDEARKRKTELDELFSGAKIAAQPHTELAWENLIDLVPLMQLTGRAYEQHVARYVANEAQFEKHHDELRRNAELIAVLARAATFENMPNADDGSFCGYAKVLIQSARQIVQAVDDSDASAARLASGQMGQCCQKCHEGYR